MPRQIPSCWDEVVPAFFRIYCAKVPGAEHKPRVIAEVPGHNAQGNGCAPLPSGGHDHPLRLAVLCSDGYEGAFAAF